MKLTDCNLDVGSFLIAPLVVARPTPEWLELRENKVIPEGLFRLYMTAHFLSLDSVRGFLADSHQVLFGYFGTLLRGLRALHVESKEELNGLNEAFQDTAGFAKRLMSKSADARARRHLKHFLIAQTGLLDAVAELIALFFSQHINGLTVGRADFGKIETWLQGSPVPFSSSIVSPDQYFVGELHKLLYPLIVSSGEDRDWFLLLQLLRNKLAHISHPVMFIGLHDAEGKFYTFIPKRWPFIKEEFYVQGQNPNAPPLAEHYRRVLIPQDLLSFCEGLAERISAVVNVSCEILTNAYAQFEHLPASQRALDELARNSKEYGFEGFF
ncbi:MAG: hypothetical protein ABJB61_11795 [bacterium]